MPREQKTLPKYIIADVAADLTIGTVHYSGNDKDAAKAAFDASANAQAIHASKAAGFRRKKV